MIESMKMKCNSCGRVNFISIKEIKDNSWVEKECLDEFGIIDTKIHIEFSCGHCFANNEDILF